MQSTAGAESAVEQAMTDFNEALHMFDPFRFRAWAELGLTTAQLRVMFLLRENPGVTAGELAARLAVTPPTISGIVDRLVRLGLVRREDDPSDRRLVRNFLTEQGENNCGRLARGGELFTRRIMVEMEQKDLEALIQGLRAFINASKYVSRVQPNLAEVAMHGSGRG